MLLLNFKKVATLQDRSTLHGHWKRGIWGRPTFFPVSVWTLNLELIISTGKTDGQWTANTRNWWQPTLTFLASPFQNDNLVSWWWWSEQEKFILARCYESCNFFIAKKLDFCISLRSNIITNGCPIFKKSFWWPCFNTLNLKASMYCFTQP